jgi:predicted component of type VI protein secretion system
MAAEPLRLEVVAGRAEGMSILVEDELLIGRQADGAGRLADDDEISRSHARVSLDASGFCAIEDLGSTNGTFVNGLRISVPQTLFDGDTIELGGTTLVVRGLPQTPSDHAQAPAPEAAEPEPERAAPPLAQDGAAAALAPEGAAPPTVYESAPPPATDVEQPPAQEAALGLEPDATIIPGATPEPPRDTAGEQAPAEVGVAFAPTGAGGTPAPQGDTVQASIQLAVDFDSRELTITLAGEEQPLRLVYDGQCWRAGASPG